MPMMPSAVMAWATRTGAGPTSAGGGAGATSAGGGAGATSAGGGAGVSPRQNPASAVIPSPRDGWPVVQADQASPSMVQPTGIKQKASPSDISTMPSTLAAGFRPDC